jgi:putative spermidine/putrescine transport system substrate-binding protein
MNQASESKVVSDGLQRREFLARAGAIGLAFTAPRLACAASAKELVVASWGGPYQEALRKAHFEPFSKQTGIKVIETTFEDPLSKIKAMVEARNVEWDIVNVGDRHVIIGAREGLLEPIDYKSVSTTDLLPAAVHSHGVGSDLFANAIGYHTRRYSAEDHPRNWAEFWDVKRFPGPRSLRKVPFANLEFALLADGVPPAQLYPLDVERAFRSLDRIKPHVVAWWTSGAQFTQLLSNGEVDLAAIWDGEVVGAIAKGAPIGVERNQGLLSGDWWAVPKGAPHRENAMRFLAFATQAEPQANQTKYVSYAPVNRKAFDFIDAKTARSLTTHPDYVKGLIKADNEWWGKHNVALTERFNAWLIK